MHHCQPHNQWLTLFSTWTVTVLHLRKVERNLRKFKIQFPLPNYRKQPTMGSRTKGPTSHRPSSLIISGEGKASQFLHIGPQKSKLFQKSEWTSTLGLQLCLPNPVTSSSTMKRKNHKPATPQHSKQLPFPYLP